MAGQRPFLNFASRPRVCKNSKLRRACKDFPHATAALVPGMTSAFHFNCALDKLGDTLSHHRRTPAGFYTLWADHGR